MNEIWDDIKETTRNFGIYLKMFAKWGVISIIAGSICGILGSLFHFCVGWATQTRTNNPWLILFLPLSGIAIVAIYHACGVKKDEGTNLVIYAIRESRDLPANMTFLIFIGTVLTHLCGGSTGREGAALQIGGSVGNTLGRLFQLDENEKKIITMCGMSALFTALFGTPLAATVFSMEVITVGVMEYAAFLPCAAASMIAYEISIAFRITPMGYVLSSVPGIAVAPALKIIVLALACCLASVIFVKGMQRTSKILAEKIPNQYIRVVSGGIAVVLLTLLFRTTIYNGAGMDTIEASIHGDHIAIYVFLVKILFTVITMCCGFKGGEIVPAFFIGATLGNALSWYIGLDPAFGAAIGMICVFCCVVNCPMASVIMSIELFGTSGVLYFALGCAVSFMVSGYFSLYTTQQFLFSKRPIHRVIRGEGGREASEWKKEAKEPFYDDNV